MSCATIQGLDSRRGWQLPEAQNLARCNHEREFGRRTRPDEKVTKAEVAAVHASPLIGAAAKVQGWKKRMDLA